MFRRLQSYLDRSQDASSDRAALVTLEDAVVVFTQIVAVFSELQTLVDPVLKEPQWSSMKLRANWWLHERKALNLIEVLQRHKISLLLILQIFQWLASSTAWPQLLSIDDH